jgi:hypothetical protein
MLALTLASFAELEEIVTSSPFGQMSLSQFQQSAGFCLLFHHHPRLIHQH